MTKLISQGAEAKIFLLDNLIIKDRIPKTYRLKELDDKIRKSRTKAEAKLLEKANKIIPAPKVIKSDDKGKIILEFIDGKKLSEHLDNFSLHEQKQIMYQIGQSISKLHEKNIIHGDLTTSNMICVVDESNIKPITTLISLKKNLSINNRPAERSSEAERKENNSERSEAKFKIFFIDFGLGFQNGKIEDKAVDIHLLRQALEAKHFKNWKELFHEVEKGYLSINHEESEKVLQRFKSVEKRGRYKEKY